VTGRPWHLPYLEYEKQYTYVSTFSWDPLRPPLPYRHEIFRRFYREYVEYTYYLTTLSPTHWSYKLFLLRVNVFTLLLGWPLVVPLLVAVLRPRRGIALALATFAAVLGALLLEAWCLPHYFAPGVGALALLVTLGLRRMAGLRIGTRPIGRLAVALVVAASVAAAVPEYETQTRLGRMFRQAFWSSVRARLASGLERRPGKQLVIVRYGPGHRVHDEWVYNRADIDGAHVVWAREMDSEHNRRLLEYFHDREAWLLQPDAQEVGVVPYPRDVSAGPPDAAPSPK
jgi:hypothetical protein